MQSEHTLYALALLEAKLNEDHELQDTLMEEVEGLEMTVGLADMAFVLLMLNARNRSMEPKDLIKALRTTVIARTDGTTKTYE